MSLGSSGPIDIELGGQIEQAKRQNRFQDRKKNQSMEKTTA